MDKVDRKAEAAVNEFVETVAPKPSDTGYEAEAAVAQSIDDLEARTVEVTGIKGNDDDGLVVGRVTFSPEVNQALANAHRKDSITDDLPDAKALREMHASGWRLTSEARVKAGLDEEEKHVPLPPVPEGTYQPTLSRKDTNPKDAVGTKKWRQYCTVPTTIIWELGVAMLEGARKYGRHNYRIAGVRASVYVDAAKGHIDQWWEGEDIDEESKLNHIVKAIASLAVLRDAMIHNKWVDDRPPKTDLNTLRADLQVAVDGIFERIPDAKDAYLEGDQYDD